MLGRIPESWRLVGSKKAFQEGENVSIENIIFFLRKRQSWLLFIFLLVWASFSGKITRNSSLSVDTMPFRAWNQYTPCCASTIHIGRNSPLDMQSSAFHWNTGTSPTGTPTWTIFFNMENQSLLFLFICSESLPILVKSTSLGNFSYVIGTDLHMKSDAKDTSNVCWA